MTITLHSPKLRLTIDPALGAGLVDLSIAGPSKWWYPMMRRSAPGETNSSNLACFNMAPYSNRIRDAKFEFAGVTRPLRATSAAGVTPVVAQHGDVRSRPWRVLDRTPVSARLRIESGDFADFNWPWAMSSEVRYELQGERLTIELSVTNESDTPMPAGCGLHPYFARRLWRDDDVVTLRAACTGRYPIADGMPTGPATRDALVERLSEARPLPDEYVDAVLGGFGGEAVIHWPQSGVTLTMRTTPNLGHLVVFVPHSQGRLGTPLPFFAVEPVTNVNDGFNLMAKGEAGTGVVVLKPGERLVAGYEVVVS